MEENRAWHAEWIWIEDDLKVKPQQAECTYFRRTFRVDVPMNCSLRVDVSADSRYQLYFNGDSVSVGPCKGDGATHHYETVDLSSRLIEGRNVIVAKVLHYPISQPFSMLLGGPNSVWRSASGAFFMEGALQTADGDILETLHTDSRWKCYRDLSFRLDNTTPSHIGGYERIDGRLLPHGWRRNDFDDSGWLKAVSHGKAYDPLYGRLMPWLLTPRPIPPLYETPKTFARLMKSSRNKVELDSILFTPSVEDEKRPLIVRPGESFSMEVDAGELTTGYVMFSFFGGEGSNIRLVYAESYSFKKDSGKTFKAVRDDSSGEIIGDSDEYVAAGVGTDGSQQSEVYEPFSFRTFRFIRVEVQAGSTPIHIVRFHYRETGYPLELTGDFHCSDETMRTMWEISVRTLQRCMHETYEDCPYYEQLQYTMDTRLQMLFSYHLSSDDRLARKALYDFHSSLLPSGMLQSRYPSVNPQIIPGFSLYWVLMVYDHYLHYGDKELVRMYVPTIEAVLNWFRRRVNERGIVGPAPRAYWSFVDWTAEWKRTAGAPTASKEGPITVYSLMYSSALQAAAKLNSSLGRNDVASEYTAQALQINQAVLQHCLSGEKGLFQDGPGLEQYSQHAQIWSVLADVVVGEDAKKLMLNTLDDPHLTQASFAMKFFLFRALMKSGLYRHSFVHWDEWRRLFQLHLTTWIEDPVSQRSDCHAWSAVPLYDFPSEILGVKPLEPGFAKISIAPQPGGGLTWARGTVATVRGPVHVSWNLDKNGRFVLQVERPSDIAVEVRFPDGTVREFAEYVPCEADVILKSVQ